MKEKAQKSSSFMARSSHRLFWCLPQPVRLFVYGYRATGSVVQATEWTVLSLHNRLRLIRIGRRAYLKRTRDG